MAQTAEQKQYNSLMTEVGQLFEHGREESRRSGNHAQTLACWEIGRRIMATEHGENGRAPYGEALLEKLSEDLTKKYGQGFSRRNLTNMLTLCRTYGRKDLNANLSWSQYVLLFTVSDPGTRQTLERRAIREKLSYLQLKKAIRIENGRKRELQRPTGVLHTYRITTREMHSGKTERYLDLGFGVYQEEPANLPTTGQHTIFHIEETTTNRMKLTPGRPADLWLYRARLERIVDADTLIVLVELPNKQHTRIRIRLAGVEIPERGTELEAKTRKYVAGQLQTAKAMIIKTHGQDRYGRYVTDVLYSTTTTSADRILKHGQHLNAQLIQRERRRAA